MHPTARRLDLVEQLHGHRIADPYRWLEDAGSEETQQWLAAQDDLARPALDSLPGRGPLAERLRQLMPGYIGPPTVIGDRSFFTRRYPDQEHPVLLVAEADGTETVLVDPSALSADLTTTLDGYALSKEGDRLAYQLSEGGNEDPLLWVMDTRTGETVEGPIDRTKYGNIAWLPGGEEYIYVRRLAPDAVPAGEELFHRRVWRHRVGTDPSTDTLLFGEGYDKTAYFGVSVSRDGRWLLVRASLGTAPRNDLFIADLQADAELVAVQRDVDAMTQGFVGFDGRLYLFTNLDAPRWRLAVADPADPQPDRWTDLLPQSDAVLTDVTLTDDAVVAVRTRDVVSEVTVHDRLTGEPRSKIGLPGLGFAQVSSRPDGGDEVWIGYTDHLTPYQVLHHRVSTGETSVWADAPGAVATLGLSAKQVFYPSADGTRIPMFVLARDDIQLDGSRPTILYGYGGFNVSMDPGYSSSILAWVEAGGVYAVANLRGGSEYGEEWHRAGMRDKKQNVFDDFIAAAEWLIAQGYTSPPHLGISGGSNGGLLVGATLTQRPDLFGAVVCSAPLLDMVRYEQFLIGRTWNDEYGSADDPTELGWLLSYSPYHRVQEGTDYPAVLFTSFDADTRTDPCHARKMCAALQWATAGDRPILFRREANVGHSARAVSRTIDLQVDTLTFMAWRLGLQLPV
jgi:prolyl oligopeptidase